MNAKLETATFRFLTTFGAETVDGFEKWKLSAILS
jgi:hypothetical protein